MVVLSGMFFVFVFVYDVFESVFVMGCKVELCVLNYFCISVSFVLLLVCVKVESIDGVERVVEVVFGWRGVLVGSVVVLVVLVLFFENVFVV